MGDVTTLTLERGAAKALRRMAMKKYGRRKGALGRIASEAILALEARDEDEAVNRRALERLKKGYNLGGIRIKDRGAWHER
ncbi:MAG: hypothetical protein KGH60_03270 [Candidatus Micrarchaeota archaeon]|nr:hypothetical protein [Candidatus Micrarchaeota archaeon]